MERRKQPAGFKRSNVVKSAGRTRQNQGPHDPATGGGRKPARFTGPGDRSTTGSTYGHRSPKVQTGERTYKGKPFEGSKDPATGGGNTPGRPAGRGNRSSIGSTFDHRSAGTEQGERTRKGKPFARNAARWKGKKRRSPLKKENEIDDKSVRLNKFLAEHGVSSRREADQYIATGLVTINGKTVTEMGVKVLPGDDVRFNGERLREERKVYILLNKPKDYITTLEDPNAKKTVMDLIRGACRERVYPVGRLDRNSTGILLITNDGDLTRKLTHPSNHKKKIYHVFLNKTLKAADMHQLAEGIQLEDGPIKADEISYVEETDKSQVGVEIHSGRNRVVRRMFEQLGYEVKKLDRVYFAGLTKKGLPRGHWRFLSDKEIRMLKTGAYE